MSRIYKKLLKLNNNKWAKDLNRHFSKEGTQVVNKHMRRCSTSLTIREMQIKTVMRYHLTPSKRTQITNVGEDVEKKTLLHCWCECKLVQPLWKKIRSFLRKLKIELPCDPAIPFLAIYRKRTKTLTQRYMHPSVHCSTIYNNQDMEAT